MRNQLFFVLESVCENLMATQNLLLKKSLESIEDLDAEIIEKVLKKVSGLYQYVYKEKNSIIKRILESEK